MGRSSAARVASRAGPTRGGRSLTSCATIPMKTPPRRMPDSLADRVTRLEVLMESLGHQIARELDLASKIHTDLATVSERQTGKWYACLWMSAVEWLRMVRDSSIPATHAEGDALRAASGDLGPSNFGNLAVGVPLRYGWTLPKLIPATALWIALEPS